MEKNDGLAPVDISQRTCTMTNSFFVITSDDKEIPARLNSEQHITDNVEATAKAFINLPEFKTKQSRDNIAVSCFSTARKLGLKYFDGSQFADVSASTYLSENGNPVTRSFVEMAEARAVASVKPTNFNGLNVVMLAGNETFEDYREQIEADKAGVKVICGPTGVGKTKYLDKTCLNTVSAGGRFAHYSPFRNIVQSTELKFAAAGVNVSQYQTMTAGELMNIERYSVISTMHSRHTDRVAAATRTASIEVADEFFSGLRQIATFRDMPARYSAFSSNLKALSTANPRKPFFVADADMNNNDLDILRAANNPSGISVYYKARDYSSITITIHDHYSCIVSRFFELTKSKSKVIFACDEKATCEAFHKIAQSNDARGLLITQDTAHLDAVQRFELDPNGELERENYDYVIYSPRYFRYGSIEIDYFQSHLALACGIVTPADFIQALRRDRTATEFHIAIKTPKKLGYWDQHWNSEETDEMISWYCAESRFLAEETAITLPAALKALHFNVVNVRLPRVNKRDGSISDEISLSSHLRFHISLYNDAKRALRSLKTKNILNSDKLSVHEAKKLNESRDTLTDKERNEVDRTLCEFWLGGIKNNDVKWYAEGGAIAKLRMLSLPYLSDSECAKLDQANRYAEKSTAYRYYYAARKRDLSPFLSEILSDDGFNFSTLKSSIELIKCSEEWKYYGLPIPPKSTKQQAMMGFALKLALKLGFEFIRTDGGKRYTITNRDLVDSYKHAFAKTPDSLISTTGYRDSEAA